MVLAYIGIDLGLYIVVKIFRVDFWYWIPLGGKAEIVMSAVARTVVKIVANYTSIIHLRHPYELG